MKDLSVLLGKDYKITDAISIHQPTIREIIEYGEPEYFQLVGKLTVYPSDMMSELWDSGIDYENISDFDMFVFMTKFITLNESRILFGDTLDFTKLNLVPSPTGDNILQSADGSIKIDFVVYKRIFTYLTSMHNIVKDHKYAGNEHTKKVLIDLDRQDKAFARTKPYESSLYNFVSTLVNSSGFKYNYATIQDITLCQLMDAVERVQIIEHSLALLRGSYGGMVDTSKIDQKYFNWFRTSAGS